MRRRRIRHKGSKEASEREHAAAALYTGVLQGRIFGGSRS